MRAPKDARARIAIDLGAESCRVSLLRWLDGEPSIELIHRIPNGPVHERDSMYWPLERIWSGLEQGLYIAAERAPEGVVSIAVDGWAVDYVRVNPNGSPLSDPYCYRDERTLASKEYADKVAPPEWMFSHTGAQPIRINTVYQLVADGTSGIDIHAPWMNLPEFVLHRLGGRRVAEYTNATHTGLVDLATGDWAQDAIKRLNLSVEAVPPIVATGTLVGRLTGPLAELPPFRETQLIVPACHDTASAIAGIPSDMENTAYICSGTWSLVGTLVAAPIVNGEALRAGFTNQGAASGGFLFHSNVNGMWILKQCLEHWRRAGRPWELQALIAEAEKRHDFPGVVPVDAPSLLLDGDMPALLDEQLIAQRYTPIKDSAGNEPLFARTIFESLAVRYATALQSLEHMLGKKLRRIHILGGGSQNQLLTRLTAEHTGLPVETGNVESSTVGNFAVQMAASELHEGRLQPDSVQRWARRLCENRDCGVVRTEPAQN